MNAHEERMAQLARDSLERYSREELLEFALTIRLSLRECQKQLRAALKQSRVGQAPAVDSFLMRDEEIVRRFTKTKEPVIDIACAFKLSPSRVYQIIWKARRSLKHTPSSDIPASAQSPQNGPVPRSK